MLASMRYHYVLEKHACRWKMAMASNGRFHGQDASLTNDSRRSSPGCKHAEDAGAAANIKDPLSLEELCIGHDGVPVGLCAGLHISSTSLSNCVRLALAGGPKRYGVIGALVHRTGPNNVGHAEDETNGASTVLAIVLEEVGPPSW